MQFILVQVLQFGQVQIQWSSVTCPAAQLCCLLRNAQLHPGGEGVGGERVTLRHKKTHTLRLDAKEGRKKREFIF